MLADRPASFLVGGLRRSHPQFRFAFVGKHGSGKSTTLRWAGYYAGLPARVRSRFKAAARGGGSYTRTL